MIYLNSPTYYNCIKNICDRFDLKEKIYGKSIMITGANGLLGSFMIDILSVMNMEYQADITIYCWARSKERLIERLGEKEENGKVYLVSNDFEQMKTIDTHVDYLIHTAGNAHPESFRTDPIGTLLGTINNCKSVLDFTNRNSDCRLLYLSTGEIYASIDNMQARACYPQGKRTAETLCATYFEQYCTDVVIARCCHVLGPNNTERDNRAGKQFLMKACQKEDIVLKSDGCQLRSYQYIADTVLALLYILCEGKSGQAYDVAGSQTIMLKDLAKMCADMAGTRVLFETANQTEQKEQTPIKTQVMDNGAILSLGWKEYYSLEDGIRECLQIMREMREYD